MFSYFIFHYNSRNNNTSLRKVLNILQLSKLTFNELKQIAQKVTLLTCGWVAFKFRLLRHRIWVLSFLHGVTENGA